MPDRIQVPSTHQESVLDALIGATPPAAQLKRPAAPEPTGSKQEKLPAYAPHWLIVQRLEEQYNDGAPFPARARRKLRTGPPIQ